MLFLVTVALGAPLIPDGGHGGEGDDQEAWGRGVQDPSTTNPDPDLVCVSFKVDVSEAWCYATCTGYKDDGRCPPEVAGECMCGKGPSKQQQAQASQPGMTKGWASGAVLPKAAEAPPLVAPSAVAVAPTAVAVAPVAELPVAVAPAAVAEDGTPLPSLAAPTDPSCISLKTGTPDFWCQNTCGAKTNYCPEDTCKCGKGALQESQAKASAAMDAWNEAERQNRLTSGESDQAATSPAAQQAAAVPVPAAQTAADAWAAAAAQVPPEPVTAIPDTQTAVPAAAYPDTPAAAAVSPAAQPVNGAGLAGPEPTQPTDAWKAAAEAASKPQVAAPLDASPLPVAPPVLTPQAQKNVAEREANTAARDADIASRPVTEDWVAAAKADMDKVMADRDAEIAARTDGTSVPVNAVAPAQ